MVVIGVAVGVNIVSEQLRGSVLKDVVKQQATMLEMQQRIEKKIKEQECPIAALPQQVQPLSTDPQFATMLQKQGLLEQRIAVLEAQLKGLQQIFQQVQAPQRDVPAAPPSEDFTKVYDIEIAHSYVRGNKDAPVSIVEFVDFQCPFCARFHPPILEVLRSYPDKVNYVVKNLPLSFHPQARPAAKAAFAAGEQGKYTEMVDALLTDNSNLSDGKFQELAQKIGLNVKKFLKDYESKDTLWEDYIEKDIALGNRVNVRGTPTFFINGRKTNARDFASLKLEIDKILQEKGK